MTGTKVEFGGYLYAVVRDCWVSVANRRISTPFGNLPPNPAGWVRAAAVEVVKVEEPHRRQGLCRAFLAALRADSRFDLVVVECVQNPVLAEALMRWGWECDPGVMDFYTAGGKD